VFLIGIICYTKLTYERVLLNFHITVFSCKIMSLTEMLFLQCTINYGLRHMQITYIFANVMESTTFQRLSYRSC